MARRGWLCVVLACAVLSEALSAPHVVYRIRRQSKLDERNLQNAELEHSVHGADLSRKVRQDDGITTPSVINKDLDSKNEVNSPDPVENDDDDDDFDEPMDVSNSGGGGGGSNIFSLLRLATSLFPGSSGGNGIGSLSSSSGSSGQQGGSSQPASPFITLKLDIFRAVLQFATSLIGSASSSSSGAASPA